MAFDRDYPNRKDRRKSYRGSARFDRSCRPGGDCPMCESDRKYRALKRMPAPDNGRDPDEE
jgi:hypothetical protein